MHWTYGADPSITSLPALVRARMRDPAKAFIRNGDGRTFTYAETWDLAGRLAGALRAHGVGVGDRVAVQVEKSPRRSSSFSPARGRRVYLPLNTAYTLNEIGYFLGDAEPTVIVSAPAKRDGRSPPRRRPWRRGDAVARTAGDGTLMEAAAAQRADFDDAKVGGTISPPSSTPPAPPGARRARCSATTTSPRMRCALVEAWRFTRRRRAAPRAADLSHARAVRGDQHAAAVGRRHDVPARSSTPTR